MRKHNEIITILKEYHDIQIEEWVGYKNISREKCELFHDFIVSLYKITDKTFLGLDVLYDIDDQKKHFRWCWNKTLNNFKEEKINFNNDNFFYNYFETLFINSYYKIKEINEESKILLFMDSLFNFNNFKSETELLILEQLYNLIDNNLKK